MKQLRKLPLLSGCFYLRQFIFCLEVNHTHNDFTSASCFGTGSSKSLLQLLCWIYSDSTHCVPEISCWFFMGVFIVSSSQVKQIFHALAFNQRQVLKSHLKVFFWTIHVFRSSHHIDFTLLIHFISPKALQYAVVFPYSWRFCFLWFQLPKVNCDINIKWKIQK